MPFGLLLFFFAIGLQAHADITTAARYEYIRGPEDELANRLLLKSKFNYDLGPFGIYLEGFGELEGNEDQKFIRRTDSTAYLQEAYLEFKLDSFYLRVGRQAIRWSESWTLPSLDVWTGRRYNRLFFDPWVDQFTHSTGILASYARESFSVDFVGVGDVAPNYYPVPIPEENLEKNTSFGGRVKLDFAGFGFSALTAQVLKKNYYGVSGNYAFEKAVPKFEAGSVHDSTLASTKKDLPFFTAGCDLFLGNWAILPQVSIFEAHTVALDTQNQVSYYLSTQWNPNRHDLQFQFYRNDTVKDLFGNVSYGYNLTDYLTVSGFVQNYEGQQGLYQVYEEITGGWAFGARIELTGNLAF